MSGSGKVIENGFIKSWAKKGLYLPAEIQDQVRDDEINNFGSCRTSSPALLQTGARQQNKRTEEFYTSGVIPL